MAPNTQGHGNACTAVALALLNTHKGIAEALQCHDENAFTYCNRFNLGATKAKVLKSLEPSTPAVFRKFFTSADYDRLLTQLMLHFVAVFQHEALSRSMERARRQHLEGYNPYTVAARLHELENEIEETRQSLSPCYMLIILHHASYQKPVQDRCARRTGVNGCLVHIHKLVALSLTPAGQQEAPLLVLLLDDSAQITRAAAHAQIVLVVLYCLYHHSNN